MELWLILTIVGVCLLLITLTLLVIIFNKKKKNNVVSEYPELIEALGNKENIISSSFKGSRVNIEVKDKKLVDKEKLKQGVVDTVVISSKKVTIVVGNDLSDKISDYLNKIVDIQE